MKPITIILLAGILLLSIAGAQDKPTATGQEDPMPTLVKRADPKYPDAALKAKIQGTVYIQALVNTEGKVAEVKVIKSDAKELDSAAIDAAKNFVFEAAKAKGKPVATWVTIPFKFRLEEKKDAKK
jgi:TonB family protein